MTCARRFALPTVALLAIGLVPVSSAAQPAYEGVYIARGVDSDGKEYRRAVEIERHGDSFTVTWVSARLVGEAVVLEPSWFGLGIVTGDVLSVSFVTGETFGIIVYQASVDGRELSGRWTLAGDDEAIHTEVLTRLPDRLLLPAAAREPTPNHQFPIPNGTLEGFEPGRSRCYALSILLTLT